MRATAAKTKISDAQKARLLSQIDAGTPINEICGAHNISPAVLSEWRVKLAEIERWRVTYKKKSPSLGAA